MNTNQSPSQSYVDEYTPPETQADSGIQASQPAVSQPVANDAVQQPTASSQSESLEDQNIFAMLAVEDGTAEEKEAFLDELQQVIWEDFLEYDVRLLITTDEQNELQQIMTAQYGSDLEKQEKIIVFLEKLIPDLEDIMLEKALELKADMFFERIAGMREYYANNQAALEQITAAETMAKNDQWSSAIQHINSVQ